MLTKQHLGSPEENRPLKVLLAGGHAATGALAIVEEVSKKNLNWRLYWIGPYSAMESYKVTSAGEKILKEYGVVTEKVIAGRALKSGSILLRLKAYLKIPLGFIHAFFLVTRIFPDVVLSFGGFAAFPVVFSAWVLRKPILLHEQVAGAGLANRLSAPFARRIAIARSESFDYFPKNKTVLVGNPQVSGIFSIKKKDKIGTPPVLLVTGGSSGSVVINDVVDECLEQLLADYIVIHQTGDNNISKFMARKEKLAPQLRGKYTVFGYVNPERIVKYYEKSDIVVCRAGANTVSDIITIHRPAILVPIPWSIGDEQRKNAQIAVRTGLARIIEQDRLTASGLLTELVDIRLHWSQIVHNATTQDFSCDSRAASKIVSIIFEIA